MVRYILARLHVLLQGDAQRLRDYLGMFQLLSGNRDLQAIVEEEKDMLSSIELDRLPFYRIGRKDGIEKGIRKGMEKGMQKGRKAGISEFLVHQLEKKFGPLSIVQRQRIQQAGLDELNAWGERLLDAGSLDELFSEPVQRS